MGLRGLLNRFILLWKLGLFGESLYISLSLSPLSLSLSLSLFLSLYNASH